MAVIVAGGAGFLGSHLVDRLIKRETVVVFDYLVTGRIANLEHAITSGRAKFVYTTVAREAAELDELYREATPEPLRAIYHLASPAGSRAVREHAWETLAANGLGTTHLLELARRHRAKLLFASSAGAGAEPPGPSAPCSYDLVGKRFGEAAVLAATRTLGVDARIARIFNGYGPRMQVHDGRLVPALISAANAGAPFPIFGDGTQLRSMTHVRDLVEGLVCLMDAPAGPAPVDLGSDEEHTVLEIAQAFARAAHLKFDATLDPERHPGPPRRAPSLEAARSLGWAPRVALEEGLWETIAWYRFALHGYAVQ